ncbi:MAG: hypothetical protein U0667_15300 [Chloroflexota bacterium]
MLRALAPVMARHPEVVTIVHARTQDQGGDLWHESSKYPDGIREQIDVRASTTRSAGCRASC